MPNLSHMDGTFRLAGIYTLVFTYRQV
jgi:hypothetical protein